MTEAEGVIKFSAEHEERALPASRFAGLAAQLAAWREIMCGLGVVGQDASRYDGAGFGNVSGRCGPFPGGRGQRPFLITGTQTGGNHCVTLDDFCLVESWNVSDNRVKSRGAALPSSESLTHGAIFDLAPHIRFVLHGHAPVLWRQRARLKLPTTADDVAYGTVAMAAEVQRLWRQSPLPERGLLAMGGHEDGIIAFGRTADEAGAALMGPIARAYEDALLREGALCRT